MTDKDGYLYEVPPYEGEDDYLSDLALERIGEFILGKLPKDGFDMPSCNATAKGVTATVHFDRSRDPMANADYFEAILRASTVVRTLHANLLAAREALTDKPSSSAVDR